MKRHLQCAEQVHLQSHHVLRLPRVQDLSDKSLNCFRQKNRFEDNPTLIPRQIVILRPLLRRPDSSRLGGAVCERTIRLSYLPGLHEMLRPPQKVTLQLHQILPRKIDIIIDPLHIYDITKRCACHAASHSTLTNWCSCRHQ